MMELQIETPLTIIARDNQQSVNAEIKCQMTNEPHEPVEIILTSPTNLLLYFQCRISPEIAIQMSSKLLMEPLKPEEVPSFIQSLVDEKVANRSFRLVADDATHYTLTVTDLIQRQIFPRLALPMIKLSSEVVQKHLEKLLLSEQQFNKTARQQIRGLQLQLQDTQSAYAAYQKEKAEETTQLNLKINDVVKSYTDLQKAFQENRQQLQSQIQLQERDINFKNQQLESLDKQFKELNENFILNDQKLQQVSLNNNKQETANLILKQQMQELQQENEALQHNKEELQQCNTTYKHQLQQMQQQLELLNSDHLNLKQNQNQSTGQLQQQIQQQQQTIQQLEKQLFQFQIENKQLTSYNEKISGDNQFLQNEITNTINALNQAVNRGEILLQEKTELLEQVHQLGGQNDEMLKMNQEQQQIIENLTTNNTQQETQLKVLLKQHDELRMRAESAEQMNGVEIMNYLQNDKVTNRKHNQDKELQEILMSSNKQQLPPKQKQTKSFKQQNASILDGYSKYFTESYNQNEKQMSQQQDSEIVASKNNKQTVQAKYVDLDALLNQSNQILQQNKQIQQQNYNQQQLASQSDSLEKLQKSSIQVQKPTSDSVSSSTKNLINHYMKGTVNTSNLDQQNSNTSSDLIFKVMKTVNNDNNTVKASQSVAQSNTNQLQQDQQLLLNSNIKQSQATAKQSVQQSQSDILNKYLNMLHAELD